MMRNRSCWLVVLIFALGFAPAVGRAETTGAPWTPVTGKEAGAPVIEGVGPLEAGYAVIGRGFGGDARGAVVLEDGVALAAEAVAVTGDGRIEVRSQARRPVAVQVRTAAGLSNPFAYVPPAGNPVVVRPAPSAQPRIVRLQAPAGVKAGASFSITVEATDDSGLAALDWAYGGQSGSLQAEGLRQETFLIDLVAAGIGVQPIDVFATDKDGIQSPPARATVTVTQEGRAYWPGLRPYRDVEPPRASIAVTDGTGKSFRNNMVPLNFPLVLDGHRSTDTKPGRIIRFHWTRLAGSGGGMAPGRTVVTTEPLLRVEASPTLPFQPGAHRFQLVVEDEAGNRSASVTAEVTARDLQPPVAVTSTTDAAGRAVIGTVAAGNTILFSAMQSSDMPPGQVVRYHWTRLEGSGGELRAGSSVSSEAPHLRVGPLRVGYHRVQLVVEDDAGNRSEPDIATVVVGEAGMPTAALAVFDADGRPLPRGPVPSDASLLLDGRYSTDTRPGRVVKFHWTRLDGKGGSLALGKTVTGTEPTLLVKVGAGDLLEAGIHRFQLVAEDDSANQSVPAVAEIEAAPVERPVAEVLILTSEGKVVREYATEGMQLFLDGRNSHDARPGRVVSYIWRRIEGPGSRLAIDQGITNTSATLLLPSLVPGRHRFQLVVEDDSGNTSAPAEAGLEIRHKNWRY